MTNNELEFDPSADKDFDPVHTANVVENLKNQGENKPEGVTSNPITAPNVSTGPVDLKKVRDTPIPNVTDAPLGGTSLTEEQILVKNKLAKQDKFPFYLPLDPGEKKGAVRAVILNTYRCEVPKGRQVLLPESIYKLLLKSYDAESEALDNNEMNLNNADAGKRRALGLE